MKKFIYILFFVVQFMGPVCLAKDVLIIATMQEWDILHPISYQQKIVKEKFQQFGKSDPKPNGQTARP
jgi:hypothetical protein